MSEQKEFIYPIDGLIKSIDIINFSINLIDDIDKILEKFQSPIYGNEESRDRLELSKIQADRVIHELLILRDYISIELFKGHNIELPRDSEYFEMAKLYLLEKFNRVQTEKDFNELKKCINDVIDTGEPLINFKKFYENYGGFLDVINQTVIEEFEKPDYEAINEARYAIEEICDGIIEYLPS